jgi:hypothetical protein
MPKPLPIRKSLTRTAYPVQVLYIKKYISRKEEFTIYRTVCTCMYSHVNKECAGMTEPLRAVLALEPLELRIVEPLMRGQALKMLAH